MAIDDTTRKINILQPLSTLIAAIGPQMVEQLSKSIDKKGRLIVTEDDEITYLSLYWDRIDESLSVDIEKEPADGKGFDETNEYDKKTHRIYPSFVAGAPTVAAQFEIQKLGYVATELPVGNSMTATFSSLSTLELEFTNKIIVASARVSAEALPFGEILSLTSSTAGVGYLSSGVSINQFISAQYTLSNLSGSGSDATVSVTANPTSVPLGDPSPLTISSGGGRYSNGVYAAYFLDETSNARASGLMLQISTTNEAVTGVLVTEGGSGYIKGDVVAISNGNPDPDLLATFTINTVSGGEITSVEIARGGGGINYAATNVSTVTPDGFEVVEDSTVTVTTAVTSSNSTDSISVIGVTADEPKSNTVTVSLSTSATYSTTYRVSAGVLNLAKERNGLTALATTEAATLPCPAITSILFEAYGSGAQTILPRTYNATHSNTEFLYYGTGGISWAEFITQSEFTGANPPIEVPESVTHPDTVYAYYRDGAYLLPDSSWIVGIIGSETDYEGNYEYVLYTLDNILNYKQLTTAGSSTAPCGTSDWGGDWGASIQQFAINR